MLAFTLKQKKKATTEEKNVQINIYITATLFSLPPKWEESNSLYPKSTLFIKQTTIFGRCLSQRDALQCQQYTTKQEYEFARLGKLLQLKVEHLMK